MADYLTGDQGEVSLLSGTGAPTVTNICRWALRQERPRRNITPFGSAYTRYRMTRPTGSGFFDVLLLDSDTQTPAIPNNARLQAQFSNSTTASTSSGILTGYDLYIRVESQQVLVDGISGEAQVIRYTFVVDSVVAPY